MFYIPTALFITASYEYSDPINVVINCPLCKEEHASAVAVDETEIVKLFVAAEISKKRRTYVTCSSCGVKMPSKVSCDTLEFLHPPEITGALSAPHGLIMAVLFVAAMLLVLSIFASVMSLPISIYLIVANRKVPGFRKVMGYIPLALFVLLLLLLLIAIAAIAIKNAAP